MPDRDWPRDREITPYELAGSFGALRRSVDGLSNRLDNLDTRYVMQAVDVERERRWAEQVTGLRRDVADVSEELRDARAELTKLAGVPKELADVRATLRWVSRAAVTGVLFPIIVAILAALALRGV
jgi:hypothetical protein